MEEYFKQYYY